jgi:hypothetical protein
MLNKSGGSSHDPRVKLPAPMWEGGGVVSRMACNACRTNPDSDKRRDTRMRTFQVKGGPAPGIYRACPRCDRATG